jgi:hypothetical protein
VGWFSCRPVPTSAAAAVAAAAAVSGAVLEAGKAASSEAQTQPCSPPAQPQSQQQPQLLPSMREQAVTASLQHWMASPSEASQRAAVGAKPGGTAPHPPLAPGLPLFALLSQRGDHHGATISLSYTCELC